MKIKKRGFTLVELLAVIVILAIILAITLATSNNVLDDVTDNIDNLTKELILKAADEYVIEFRESTKDWKEHEDENGEITFCISLQSLIDKGFYDVTDEYINENKDDILVSVRMNKNKVLSYDLIDKRYTDEYCSYNKSSIKLNNKDGHIDIKDDNDTNDVGQLDYKIKEIDAKTYDVDINFLTKLGIDVVERTVPVYVVIVLDNSGSMDGEKWTNARGAAISLSETIVNNLDDAKVALVQFNAEPKLSRAFENKALTASNFILAQGNTNVSGGLDLSVSLYKELSNIPDNSMLYTILLYDGAPSHISYLSGSNTLYNSSANSYYSNFLSAYYNKNSNYKLYNTSNNNITYIQNASNYLKKTVTSKLLSIGYSFSGSTGLKEISSIDNEFCANSDYTSNTYNYNELTLNDVTLENKALTYPFKYNEESGSIVSTNTGVRTEAYGVYELDLTNYSSNEEIELSFDYTLSGSNNINDFIYIVINQSKTRTVSKYGKYYCSSTGWSGLSYCNTTTASGVKVNLDGGKKYYIHIFFEQNNSSNKVLTINNITYKSVNTETIYDNANGYSNKFYLASEEESRIVFSPTVSNDNLILTTSKLYTTSAGYKELDLTGLSGNYLLTVNASSKVGAGTIYISTSTNPPQMPAISSSYNSRTSSSYYFGYSYFNSNTYKRMFDNSVASDFNFLLTGGTKYYVHFMNDVYQSSPTPGNNNFTINDMSLVKMSDNGYNVNLEEVSGDNCSEDNLSYVSCLKKSSTYNYNFNYTNGSLMSTNKEISNSCSHSYIEINLENYSNSEYYAINFSSLVSSESRYDIGNIVITNSTASPTTVSNRYCTYSSGNTCVAVMSGSSTSSSYVRLQGGKKYYAHFTYCKDGSANYNNDYFAINKINIYKTSDYTNYKFNDVVSHKNYTFKEQSDKSLISTNEKVLNTISHRYIKIDLSNYTSSDRFSLEVDNFVSSNNTAYLYLTSSATYPASSSSIYSITNANYTSAQTFEKLITGGQVYYLHFVYYKSSTTNSSSYKDIYRIDGVRVKKYVGDGGNKINLANDIVNVNDYNYSFTKNNTSYSSNVNNNYSSAYSKFLLDLSNYSSKQTIKATFNITSKSSTYNSQIRILTSSSIPTFYNYNQIYYLSSGTNNYTISLTGGSKYYVHLYNYSSTGINNMTINNIKLEEQTLKNTDHYCYYDADVDSINSVFASLSNKVSESVPKLSATKAKIVLTTKQSDNDKAFHIEDKDGNLVDSIYKEIDLTNEEIDLENYTIEFSDKYRFVLDKEVKCPNNEKSCKLEIKLFDIQIVLDYDDGATKVVKLDDDMVPTILVKIESGQAVN